MKMLGTQRLLINSRFTKDSYQQVPWELSLTGYKVIILLHQFFPPQDGAEIQAGLQPLRAEVEPKSDGVVLVIDGKHIRNLKSLQI